jgi:hypothetical protein
MFVVLDKALTDCLAMASGNSITWRRGEQACDVLG